MGVIRIEIPGRAPVSNKAYAGMHWAVRKRLVDTWHNATIVAVKNLHLRPVKNFPVEINTTPMLTGKRKRDTSAGFLIAKIIEDGLVKSGLLPDDSTEYVGTHLTHPPVFGCDEDKVVVELITP